MADLQPFPAWARAGLADHITDAIHAVSQHWIDRAFEENPA